MRNSHSADAGEKRVPTAKTLEGRGDAKMGRETCEIEKNREMEKSRRKISNSKPRLVIAKFMFNFPHWVIRDCLHEAIIPVRKSK